MKRIVTFDGEKAAKRFEMVRTAVLNAGDGKDARTRPRIRSEARVLDALDAISTTADSNNPDGERIVHIGATVTLDQADHKIVAEYLGGRDDGSGMTPWLPKASRAAVDAQDWWETAEKHDV
jgi:hypothetical protein